MKIRCAICGLEVEKSKEDVQKLRVLSRTGKVMPDKLIKLLDIYEGPCGEESEHTFSWSLEFLKQVDELKSKHKGLGEKKLGDEKEFEKTNAELLELKRKIEETEKKEKVLIVSIDSIIPQIREIEEKFEEITGTKDLNEWK